MARQISAEEFQELGRNYYKLKQYDKALETFTKGIETCQKPSLGLYDYRAATYDKLEKYAEAVKDGREMIRMNKKDVKGYLRTANVLEKMGKEETALGIYKYGMKNLGAQDGNFKLLQQLHDKLTRKLSPSAAIDPFTVLPVELAEMILEYLSFRQMVNCMRVSKGWRDYLSKLPKLWLHLDLSGARRPVPRSFANTALRNSELRMTRVTIHRFEHMDVLRNLAKAAKHLSEIEMLSLPHTMSATLINVVKNSPKLKKFVVHAEITADSVEHIFQSQPALEHAAFHAILPPAYTMKWTETLTHLHTLSLSFVKTASEMPIGIAKLLSLAPALRSLSLCNISAFHGFGGRGWPQDASQLPRLTTLILKRINFGRFPALPSTLQRLVLENDGGTLTREGSDAAWAHTPLPDLTHLSLSGFSIGPQRLEALLDFYVEDDGTLKTVSDGPDSLLGCSPRLLTPALEFLDIGTMPCTDDDVDHLVTHETGLEIIDLSNTNITGASIKMLADRLASLKRIRADNCTRISGRDAIGYAERKGIAVSYQMGEQKGERRVRYG
ncbi:uncharacterized protein SETTUDRAFT_152451 [Exserohilum turcica Et28A]|uniref:F-box domain-containing protein n=1 Tax=Exserohilum turcicum (strain 28A) TaxID=671987 RepID=R0KEN5_EXST2|nr:uncharacterized protein SETTUDRAFT_152451 [Exserohilum turcica Et28A]EOA91323.1 hypothetical protein SETTUDRAFT_152451 [Exserohilum turcica Et28A]